jgi:hypothetical protein
MVSCRVGPAMTSNLWAGLGHLAMACLIVLIVMSAYWVLLKED